MGDSTTWLSMRLMFRNWNYVEAQEMKLDELSYSELTNQLYRNLLILQRLEEIIIAEIKRGFPSIGECYG